MLVHDTRGERLILKQALPQLRVAAEWRCDPRRALRESAALRALAPLLPEGAVPTFLAEDASACAFAMTAAPAGQRPWKEDLLRGDCSPSVAERVGELLSEVIRKTRSSPELQATFKDVAIFDTLRLDAYYREIALRHPDLAAPISALIDDCVSTRLALVHGDFSPKNLLTDGKQVTIIDWECVHFGQPAFDIAFLMNHLVLKSFHRPQSSSSLLCCAERFWTAALDGIPQSGSIGGASMRHLPALLLARVDGKSPVEYITDTSTRAQIRTLARSLFREPATSPQEIFDRRNDVCR